MNDKPRRPTTGADRRSERATGQVAEGDGSIAAKGAVAEKGALAVKKIEEQAAREDIPLDQDGALTELLSDVPEENEIPENLYIAMAEILSHLHEVEESLDSRD